MSNITSLFSRLLLAFALVTSAGAAVAVPTTYHVDIDTRALAGSGYLDLTFIGLGDDGAATATVSNFMGNACGASDLFGSITGDLANTAVFQSSSYNYLDQLVAFGGMFSFDVLFDFGNTGEATRFNVSLYDMDFAYLGVQGPVATFNLMPGQGVSFSVVSQFAEISTAAAVPEPGQWLLMVTGLLLLGVMARRRTT
jgi:hypothetical protein